MCGAKRQNFFVVTYTFFALYVRFGECFRGGQYSLVSVVFAVLLTVPLPRAQPFVKMGARAPPPTESAPLYTGLTVSYIFQPIAVESHGAFSASALKGWNGGEGPGALS